MAEGLTTKLVDMESIIDQLGCVGDVIETLLAFGKPVSEVSNFEHEELTLTIFQLLSIAKVVVGIADELFTVCALCSSMFYPKVIVTAV